MPLGGVKIEEFKQLVDKAKPGTIVPIYKTIDLVDPIEFFAKLSNYGKKPNSMFLESADIVPKYGENSLGCLFPCLIIKGTKEEFEIKALNQLGKEFIKQLKGDFNFCDKVTYKQDKIKGILKPGRKAVNEEQRLKLKTHMDIIRQIAFKFKPTTKPFTPYCGLFGAISYDFIDQFEDLPENKEDILNEPDYLLCFYDNLFMVDHKQKKTYIIANALITKENQKNIYQRCIKTIEGYEKAINTKLPKQKKPKSKKLEKTTDTTKGEYMGIVENMKRHIIAGDIFQVVPSRTIISSYNSEPLDIYSKLRTLNPSPYMFYFNTSNSILLGASPEMSVRVQDRIVEIRPIAGTKPRGMINGAIDPDLDSRYETELKIDKKELAEHTMLIDLARNDIARISKHGTRYVDEPFIVEKYSHVQHLVSNVKGILKDDLDALHAYLASMNMGTLTGAPKIEAMKLIRQAEKNKRGFYGGSICYITPSGDLDSAIFIRSMVLKNKKAYVRAGAGIVYDSIAKNEFYETEKKARACLKALELAGGSE